MRRKIFPYLLLFSLVGLLLIPLSKVTAAGSVSKADMIALINGWRSNYWSNALIEDASLDSCAQWTAEEMARTNAKDHLANLGYTDASSRCGQYGFGSGKTVFVTENWAMHYDMTIDILAGYWSDAAHMYPATYQQYCYVGVGIASASDGGTYYILQAGNISGDTSCSSTSENTDPGSTSQPEATEDWSNYKNPIITSTPNYDGSIYHTVLSGQFLYDLATYYGVTVEQIKKLNNLPSDNITAGVTLLMRLAPTVTITPTRTPTVQMPTRTPTSTPVPPTPRPTRTITPTLDPKSSSVLPKLDRQWMGLGLLILSAVGFFVVFFFLFLRKPKPKD